MARLPLARFVVVTALIVAVGLISAAYVLLHQRAPVPFRSTYKVGVELSAADGVAPGLGQPVQVSGVHVGSITGARVVDGNALVTLTIDRKQLAHVYANGHADLTPITPLKDMRIDLDPGTPSAAALRDGGTLPISRTHVPVPLSDLLSTLDGDTRAYLVAMTTALGQGTHGRAEGLRRALVALGPTTASVHELTDAIRDRRHQIARLVHNLGQVTVAASRDRELASVVQAGDATLSALAGEDGSLRTSITRLPGTLALTRRSLPDIAAFADQLHPTLTALEPALRKLPTTFAALEPFARRTAKALATDVRPFARQAQPVLADLAPGVAVLRRQAPDLTGLFKQLGAFTNELAYNPPGDDEGFMFWLPWFVHNWNSLFSTEDAHGGIGRAMVMADCNQLTGLLSVGTILKLATGTAGVCKDG